MDKTSSTTGTRVTRPVARQKRSLRTEDRLLAAAVAVLNREGFERTTVPRIAAEAKLSPASIYRRFTDKDDLLRAAILRMLGDAKASAAGQVRSALLRKTLPETAEVVVAALVGQRREHPQLLGALYRLLGAEGKSTFATDALRRLSDGLNATAEVLLEHRDSIRHPEPERAVRFALLSARSSIELAASGETSLWRITSPLSEKAFAAELTRQMVAYLRRKP